MRAVMLAASLCLASCASDKLALMPPAGVDFTGRWALNTADSDDPQHLLQPDDPLKNADAEDPSQGQGRHRGTPQSGPGGQGGPDGGRGGAGPGGRRGGYVYGGPTPPAFGVMGEGLRWPGRALEIKQVSGVVAFSSEGRDRVCQPSGERAKRPHRHRRPEGRDDDDDRDGGRDAPPPQCGWSERTLIVQSVDPHEDRPPFEEHYSLSPDGTRLIEEVTFRGGNSNGFVLSRVWDRVDK
jgi:hypothetical protein